MFSNNTSMTRRAALAGLCAGACSVRHLANDRPSAIRPIGTTSRGKEVLALTPPDWYSLHSYFDTNPFHPDGRRMLYFRCKKGAKTGFAVLLDVETGHEQILDEVERYSLHTGVYLHWGPGGKHAYCIGQSLGAGGAAVKCLNACDIETGSVERLEGVRSGKVHPLTGDILYGEKEGRDVGVCRADGTGCNTIVTLVDAIAANPQRDRYAKMKMILTHFKWCPTERRLFFLIDNIDDKGGSGHSVKELYVINADGTGLRWINKVKKHPSWTPDGKRVLFWGTDAAVKNDSRIYTLTVDDEHPNHHRISQADLPSHPSMSPDGRWVIADRRDPKAGRLLMHLVDVATGKDTRLLDIGRPEYFADGTTNATHGHPVWHPDGTSVVFNAQPGDNSQVFLMRV